MLVEDRPTLRSRASRSSMLSTVSKMLAPSANGAAFRHFLSLIRRHHELVWEMTRREMLERYTGQVLGSLWALGLPLLTMGIYIFALRVALGVSPTLGIGVAVVGMLALICGLGGWSTVPLLIVAVACHLVMTAGLVYVLAAIGVFIRDVRDIVTVLLSIGLFLQPIFYGPGVAPRALEMIFYLSPISYLIWCYRDALVYGEISNTVVWLATPIISTLLFLIGYRLYRSLQPAFGNAL